MQFACSNFIKCNLHMQFEGVNFTGSLDIIRTSPAHGTAYNIIQSNQAKTNSLYQSFKLADKIYKNRIKN